MSAATAPPGLAYRSRGLYVEPADALVVADLHVGRDRTSNVELPMGERSDLTDRLGTLVEVFDPGEVVLAGDVLHSFSTVPDGVETTLSALRGVAGRVDADLVAVRGNHDGLLDSLLATVYDAYRLADGTLVVHGHERPPAPAPRYVVGHDHPALEIDGKRRPVCLHGAGTFPRSRVAPGDAAGDTVGGAAWTEPPPASADVVMLPAFSRLAAGVVCNGATAGDLQSPLLTRLNEYRPAVYDADAEETLWFPPLGEFRRLL